MKRKSKAEQAIEARITRLYGEVANGVQIPLLEIPRVWRMARAAVDVGETDEEIARMMRVLVENIRVN